MADPVARHYDAILSPVITEKATLLSEQNKVVFRVAKDATKDEIAAAVELVERLGDQSLLELRTTTGTTIVARAEAGTRIGVGDTIRVGFALDRVHLFGQDGRALRAWNRSG